MASQFEHYSKEELQKKLKNQKLFSIIHGVIIILLFVFSGLSTYENGITFNSFFPFFFLPMQYVFLTEIKKLKKALLSRK
ncbi:hypothetical protein [uncultured Polaribacter sp.]|uniref:hypothetical protein n=1 Tax=uncultured Polaribacter sp. TaxID=174711 RepID=UPI00260B46C0|nr:hypothetical protein [uncultured Polaribacter sp.]